MARDSRHGGQTRELSDVVSVVAPGMTILGDVMCDGTVRVEGKIEGSIKATKSVVVGKDGHITGDIETQDVYLNQAASYFAANRRGRPVFVHLTLDVSSGENHNLQIVRLDRRLKLLMNFVESQSMERELVIMLAALGTTSLTGGPVPGPVAEQAPLLMYRADRTVGKSVEFLCSTCDIMPTIAEWARASAIEGRAHSAMVGISLRSKTGDEDDQSDRSLVWKKNYPNQKTVIAQSPWQLILSDPPQLYDTIRDPEKSENLRQKLPLIRENLKDLKGAEE